MYLQIQNNSQCFILQQRTLLALDGQVKEKTDFAAFVKRTSTDALHCTEGVALYGVYPSNAKAPDRQLKLLIGWRMNGSGGTIASVYCELVECTPGSTFLETPGQFSAWFNAHAGQLEVGADATHGERVWSMLNNQRFAAAVEFSRASKASRINLTLSDTQADAVRPMVLPVISHNGKRTRTITKPTMFLFCRPRAHIRIRLDVQHASMILHTPQAHLSNHKAALVRYTRISHGKPADIVLSRPTAGHFGGYLFYQLAMPNLPDKNGQNGSSAVPLDDRPVYLLIGWDVSTLGERKTCATLLQFEQKVLPNTSKDKDAFLHEFVDTIMVTTPKPSTYLLKHDVHFQVRLQISAIDDLEINVNITDCTARPSTKAASSGIVNERPSDVLLYPIGGFWCTNKDARAYIKSKIQLSSKRHVLPAVYCVENQSQAYHPESRLSSYRASKTASDGRWAVHELSPSLKAESKHPLLQVYELLPLRKRAPMAKAEERHNKQVFIVANSQPTRTTLAVVSVLSTPSGGQVVDGIAIQQFVQEVDPLLAFVPGSMNKQSFVHADGHAMSVSGHCSVSTPQVMSITLQDGKRGIVDSQLTNGQVAGSSHEMDHSGLAGGCLQMTVKNRFAGLKLANPQVISTGCTIPASERLQIIAGGETAKVVTNALPAKSSIGRGLRLRYELIHQNPKTQSQPASEGRFLEINWKTNQRNASGTYAAYVRLIPHNGLANDTTSSEVVYPRHKHGRPDICHTGIDCYVNDGERCCVGVYLRKEESEFSRAQDTIEYNAEKAEIELATLPARTKDLRLAMQQALDSAEIRQHYVAC
ncbi:hypothetical protein THASP1DRAFT_25452 [Thamnocephalis sphaerospora]|uniref:Uncharacterized protein n=1 Tax=Thamnocephalis sphaerospora TaxID=78915 RepID=A0A4P9XK55_9FUNG|nr:hypothetical protein THASP1DRAFT_25452 [Thamnocephalis sphaerospora]|eukprot:RKP06173.1 hypothetical protein THASP1DRAFT_25452 [Thamnocephalis sphaerospora]